MTETQGYLALGALALIASNLFFILAELEIARMARLPSAGALSTFLGFVWAVASVAAFVRAVL